MISIKKSKNGNIGQIVLKDDLSIDQANKFKEEITQKISSFEKIEISIEELETVSLITLQVLKSICVTFSQNNILCNWVSSSDKKLGEILKTTGLDLKELI
ncbi:MAG: hypothetical protein A2Y40_00690 [Candidatus Margulisbacteria bacterium GWF2_35_9]|nr:MAG: hypothetical protein A2Y40_00690 [Candidatus Margulisbacteria bacterium GWF2_35_9]